MKDIVITQALVNEIFKQHNKYLSNQQDALGRRIAANNIFQLWNELNTTGQIDEANKLSCNGIKPMVLNAANEIQNQQWQEYTALYQEAAEFAKS